MLFSLHIEGAEAGLSLPDLAFGHGNLLGARTGFLDFKRGFGHFYRSQSRLVDGFRLCYPDLRFLRVTSQAPQIIQRGFGVTPPGHRVIQVDPGFPHVSPGIVPGRAGGALVTFGEGAGFAERLSGDRVLSTEFVGLQAVLPVMLAQFIHSFPSIFQRD